MELEWLSVSLFGWQIGLVVFVLAFAIFTTAVTAANLLKKSPRRKSVEQCPDCKCDLQQLADTAPGLKVRWLECPCKHLKRLKKHDAAQRKVLKHAVIDRNCWKCGDEFVSRNGELKCRKCRGIMRTVPRDHVLEV
jgi:hypothetical protein